MSVLTTYGQEMKATILFSENVFDFKKIPEAGGKVVHTFNFTNTGNQPLMIHNVVTSCGCEIPNWTKMPIPAAAKGFVSVIFDPNNRPGIFSKTLTVLSNAEHPSMILTIVGEVIPKPKK